MRGSSVILKAWPGELVGVGQLGLPRLGVDLHGAELERSRRCGRAGRCGSGGRAPVRHRGGGWPRPRGRRAAPAAPGRRPRRRCRGSAWSTSASVRSGPGHQRVDRRAVELLDLARGEGVVEHVHGHAHDLARLLGDVGDAVDVLPLAEGQADGDLVDDVVPRGPARCRPADPARASSQPSAYSGSSSRKPMTLRPSSRWLSMVAAKAWPRGPAPTTSTKRAFMPLARSSRKARRRMALVTRATTNCVGKRMIRKRRLTSGSLNQKSTANVATAMSTVARTRSHASVRMDQRARGRYRPLSASATTQPTA